jgi:hypothetical protein
LTDPIKQIIKVVNRGSVHLLQNSSQIGVNMPAKPDTIAAAKKASNYLIIRTAAIRGIEGKDWYSIARTGLTALCESEGFDYNIFCRVMGATSPQCSVWMNIRHTIRIARSLQAFNGDIQNAVASVPGIAGGVRKATIKTLISDNTSTLGPKTMCFAENLLGNEDMVTLDTWMGQLVGLSAKRSGSVTTKTVSVPYTATIKTVAQNLGWTPAMVQAACWTYASRELGSAKDGETDLQAAISRAVKTA